MSKSYSVYISPATPFGPKKGEQTKNVFCLGTFPTFKEAVAAEKKSRAEEDEYPEVAYATIIEIDTELENIYANTRNIWTANEDEWELVCSPRGVTIDG